MNKAKAQASFSEANLHTVIGRMFPDRIVTDQNQTIFCCGHLICASLGYTEGQLSGQPLAQLLRGSFLETMREKFSNGFLDVQPAEILPSNGVPVSCSVSGYSLGVIFGRSDLVVLQLQNLDGGELPGGQSERGNDAMDEFVYSTSHGMRGPLATIKGLINLLRTLNVMDEEHAFIVSQMSRFAEQLDDRLHRLIYFAESDKAHNYLEERISLRGIVEKLIALEEHSFPRIQFATDVSESAVVVDNPMLILALLRNVKTFFSRISATHFNLKLSATSCEKFVELEMLASNVLLTEECRKKIDSVNVGYTEILNYPEFTELYAARKVALKLQAGMQLHVVDTSMRVHIMIPVPVR